MHIDMGESGIDWPAWVQAVGSVLAIMAATLIAQAEGRRQELARWEEEVRRLQVVTFLSQQLLATMDAAQAGLSDTEPTFDPQNFDAVIQALSELPLLELSRGGTAICVINQRRGAFFFQRAYEAWCAVTRRKITNEREPREGFEGSPLDDETIRAHRIGFLVNEMRRLKATSATVHDEILKDAEINFLSKPRFWKWWPDNPKTIGAAHGTSSVPGCA